MEFHHTSSNNQEGGVTAGIININTEKQKKNNFWNTPLFKYLIAPLIVAGVAGGSYFYSITNNYMTNNDMNDQNFEVTSINQQGGITAGQVNLGAQPRHINDEIKKQLEDFQDKKITIKTVVDTESLQFSNEIREYLEENGFDSITFLRILPDRPIKGQSLIEEDGEIIITIGGNI